MKTDEIAQSIELNQSLMLLRNLVFLTTIWSIAGGDYKAKLSFDKIRAVESSPVGKLSLVTAINNASR